MFSKQCVPLISLALLLCGCPDSHRGMAPPTRPGVSATADVSAEDFDLGLLASLLNENKISGGVQGIEDYINNPSNGINYVDLDKDNKIDFVGVFEVRGDAVDGAGASTTLDFRAYKSSKPNEEPIAIANVNIKAAGQTVQIEAGYPSYVGGASSHYYAPAPYHSHGLSLGEAYLLAHLISPGYRSHPMYVSRFHMPLYRSSYSWHARPSPMVRTQTRTTVRTRTSVSPTRKAARPTSFKSSNYAQKNASRYRSKGTTNRSGVNNYKKRDSSRTRNNASGFRSRSTKPKPRAKPRRSTPRAKPRRSTPKPRPRSRSRSRSRRR